MASFFEQNASLYVDEAITVDAAIGHAVNLAYIQRYPQRVENYNEYKGQAWDYFYALAPQQTTAYIVAALSNLLTARPASDDAVDVQLVSSELTFSAQFIVRDKSQG